MVCIMFVSVSTADEYTLDGEFIKQCEVEVKIDEIVMIEQKFRRPYWSWELPAAFRERITVCKINVDNLGKVYTYIASYVLAPFVFLA